MKNSLPQPDHADVYYQNEILMVNNLKAKNAAAYLLFYKNYSPALFGIICKIIKNREDAEDVLQETFFNICSNIERYHHDKSRFFTWIVKIATNKSIDYLRSGAYKKIKNTTTLMATADELCPLACQFKINIDAIGLRELSAQLTGQHRQVINLMYFKGYTQPEVAEEMSIPLGTVKTRCRQAMCILRKKFDTEVYSFA